MSNQLKALIKVELCNLYGFNQFRHLKDKKEKSKKRAMMLVWLIVIAVACLYMGNLAYGLAMIGMPDLIPAYLIVFASMIILFFGIFKAGSVIFSKNGYDILCAMPLKKEHIVISRFMRMYVENLGLTCVVVIPGIFVYILMTTPGVFFYLMCAVCLLFVPFIPVTIATVIGALVTAISSRMKHKQIVGAVLSILSCLAIFWFSSHMSKMEEEITVDQIKNLSRVVYDLLQKVYAPAVWMGDAMLQKNMFPLLSCMVVSGAVFFLMVYLIGKNFTRVIGRLHGTFAKHEYKITAMKHNGLLSALIKKEAKRYFSSSIYLTNTIIGMVMGVVASVALFFPDLGKSMAEFPVSVELVNLFPFIAGAIFTMLPTTAASVSLEGKNWWITQTLPLRTKDVFNAKVLLNLILICPFYVVSVVLQIIALKPDLLQLLGIIVIPVCVAVFNVIFGLTLNLKFPKFNWENEVVIVKQSAPTVLASLLSVLVAVAGIVLTFIIPFGLGAVVACTLYLLCAFLLCKSNNKIDLQKLG